MTVPGSRALKAPKARARRRWATVCRLKILRDDTRRAAAAARAHPRTPSRQMMCRRGVRAAIGRRPRKCVARVPVPVRPPSSVKTGRVPIEADPSGPCSGREKLDTDRRRNRVAAVGEHEVDALIALDVDVEHDFCGPGRRRLLLAARCCVLAACVC